MQMILDTDDMRGIVLLPIAFMSSASTKQIRQNLWRMSVIRERIDKYNHRQRRVSGPVRSRFWWCSRPPTEGSTPSPASSGAPIPSFALPLETCTDGDDAIHDDVVWGTKPVGRGILQRSGGWEMRPCCVIINKAGRHIQNNISIALANTKHMVATLSRHLAARH